MKLLAVKESSINLLKRIEIIKPKYVTLKIVPDSSARNWRTEDITATLSEMFKLPIERISRDGWKLQYRVQERAAYEIVFENGKINFYFSIPETMVQVAKRRLQSVWDGATIEEDKSYTSSFDPKKTEVYALEYGRHDLFSLHTDAKDNLPLQSVFEAGRMVGKNDRARVVSYFDPIHQRSWHEQLKETWKKFRQGREPRRMDNITARSIIYYGVVGCLLVLREFALTVSDIISSGKEGNIYNSKTSDPLSSFMSMDNLSRATKAKQGKSACRANIWVIAESEDSVKRSNIALALSNAHADLNADNELVPKRLKGQKKKEVLRSVETKEPPRIKINGMILSSAESSKLVQIAGRDLQEQFPAIEALSNREVELDARVLEDGIYLGNVTYKGEVYRVYQRCNRKDWDEICLPHIVVGGMGQGKTKGFGANFVVQSVKSGFGALAIDPAKHELGNEIEASLPADKVERYNLGKTVFALDFPEITHSPRAKGRLASVLLNFFKQDADEAVQTNRFLRAAVMAMQTTRLSEIIRIFEDDDYREERIKEMPENIHRASLMQYGAESPAMRRRLLSPIYNRMDIILGDEHLMECMESDNSLDMVEIMSKKKAIIFDIAKKDGLTADQVDLFVNLLTVKIDLAMTERPNYMNVDEPHPFFVVIDEPHHFLRSTDTWKHAAVESRKWRVGYVWMFHDWAQVNKELREIVQSALPHYHLYPSSKKNFMALREEIYPFTVEDALKLKKWHAINLLRVDGEVIRPFIAKMAAPPSEQKSHENKET